MLWSKAHIPTLREAPQEAEVISHKLMLRAGMIRRLASGIYSYLPLGWKVIRKFEQIVREEMNSAGAQEVLLPVVQPKEIWEESGRWGVYGVELGRFRDRHENDFCLQPTSEEAICDLVRRDVRSYRQMPMNLYQIQTKFRDEIRPRFGVMRSREFIMKDAYSFDVDQKGAVQSYEEMRKAYRKIFTRAGLKFKPVDADTGAIGGKRSEEFTVLASSGEDEIVSCSRCEYGANQEKVTAKVALPTPPVSVPAASLIETPNLHTIEELSQALKIPVSQLCKTMIATDSFGQCIVVLMRGDHELHDMKLAALLAAEKDLKHVRLATDAELQAWNLPKGSLGPAQFPREALVVMDDALSEQVPYVVGANREGYHLKDVVFSRDAKVALKGTLRRVGAGELCPKCGSPLEILRGIEVGHVFYLGKKYSSSMKLEFTNEAGKSELIEMGCYGIGVGRTVAAAIEQNNDENGIVWPLPLAPFELAIVTLGEGPVEEFSKDLYQKFQAAGIDVIWDDRRTSPGVKLKDCDLVGIPFQVIVGDRAFKNQNVEWKVRATQKKELMPADTIAKFVLDFIKNERETLKKVAYA